ncbi:MAG: hypothetical protein EBU46_14600 [Nitrosomonadaceae bacterium]|nr:hypothetical protein [Nitrosomonadaceae bacterium]
MDCKNDAIFAARRGGALIQFEELVSENDIFNPKYWIEDIVFAYQFVPILVAVNCNSSISMALAAIVYNEKKTLLQLLQFFELISAPRWGANSILC